MNNTLEEYRNIWQRKPVLRAIYNYYYCRIKHYLIKGSTLEIGGGTGNMKGCIGEIVSTDIQYAKWLDAVADAQKLPFSDASFNNIVLFDVLHHIEIPRLFLEEAQRVLKPGGRLIVMEPEITLFSRLIYTLFHPEPIDFKVDPLSTGNITPGRDPYIANQAIPTLLFHRDRDRINSLFPQLKVISCVRLSLLSYPLSGGFRPWSLLPAVLVPTLLRIENFLIPLLGPLMAFRILGVIERDNYVAENSAQDSERFTWG